MTNTEYDTEYDTEYCKICNCHMDYYCYINGEIACADCMEEEISDDCYGNTFFRLDKGDYGPYLGLELELDVQEMEIVDILRQVPKDFYTQVDGSLHCGIEITSEPMTLKYFKENIDNFKAIFNGNLGRQANDCGIHIHMSKKFANFIWDDKYLCKLLTFFGNTHGNELFTISNRTADRYNNWCYANPYFDYHRDATGFQKSSDLRPYGYTSGYKAIRTYPLNKTIEIRIFNSSTDKNTILANMEFVQSLASFVLSSNDMTWSGYKRFIWNHTSPENIEYLIPFLTNLDLI